MASIQELREETYKVIHETEEGGNSATRIGNLYNGIIDFLGILDDRTVNPYYYDDTALKEAIRRVDAAIAELDRTLDAALVLVNQERQRLDDLVNSIDGEIQENVENMLNDAQWLQEHAQGIQQMVNEGEIEWKSEWDQNVEAYLQEVGVWAREGDVIKTQWTEIVQSVDEISSTVAEVQQDLAGRPTATQWTQITQKVNGIEQSVNALLYNGETTEALQSTIDQSIDGKVASLNLETTYASIDTEGSKDILEWMYSALRNETTAEKTYNDIVSAGKSGLLNGVSNIHTYVEVVRNGEVLDYVAGSAIEAKVNDAVTGLYNKASAGDVQTTIFSQVKKDTSDIATIVTHATGDYTSASIATKFDNWKAGLALKTDIDSASASLIATMDEKDAASALILEQTMDQSFASITTQFNNKLAGFIAYADFNEAFVTMIAEDEDNGAVAQIFARANEEGSEIHLSADKVTMTDAFANSITANTAFIGYLTGGDATFKGTIQATDGYFTGEIHATKLTLGSGVTIAESQIDGLSDDLNRKPNWNELSDVASSGSYSDLSGKPNLSSVATSGNYSDLNGKPTIPTAITDLTGSADILYGSDVTISAQTTANGLTKRTITVNGSSFTEIEGGDFVLADIGIGTDSENHRFLKIDSDGLLKARNAIIYGDSVIYGTVYASNGEFSGKITSTSGSIGGFRISDGSLGDGEYASAGTTYLNNHGYLYLQNENNQNGAIMAKGGVTLQGDASHNITITNNASNGKVNIYGSNLNLNTINSGATYIGNTSALTSITGSSFYAYSNAIQLNNSSNGSMKVLGVASLGGNVKTSSFTLPSSPNIGQFYFCKNNSYGDSMTVSAGSGQSIVSSTSKDTVSSVSIGNDSSIFVCIANNKWAHFKCN